MAATGGMMSMTLTLGRAQLKRRGRLATLAGTYLSRRAGPSDAV